MNLNELAIGRASEGLRKKEFSATELISDCLKSAHEKNGELNAYLEIFDDALDYAKKLDDMIAGMNREELASLPSIYGIPMALKDNILLEGKRATAGSKILENYTASYDAGVIRKLKDRGAIFLGKTNLDEFAMGSSTENSAFGPTRNPHDTSRVAGGSSGGSAAAVAANLCLGALGSDTGGSVRQPAALCGVVGFKPTYGAVSRHGLIAMASSLDQIGPLSKTVEDAKILFEAIAGKDLFDATSVNGKSNSDKNTSKFDFHNIKVGVPKEYFAAGLDPRIEKVIKSCMKKIEDEGAEIEEISLPNSEYALATYYVVVPSEVSANLARFDGIRYGKSEIRNPISPTLPKQPLQLRRPGEIRNLFDVYAKTRAEGFGPEVKRRIMLGTYALSAGYYDAYYLKAQKVRRLIQNGFEEAFKKVDVILGPTSPTPAFKIGEKTDNPLQMYLADIYTVAISLAGLPGISIPAGKIRVDEKDLPVGLQLVGRWFGDGKLIDTARAVESIVRT